MGLSFCESVELLLGRRSGLLAPPEFGLGRARFTGMGGPGLVGPS